MSGGGSAPSQPDPAATASAQGAANKETAVAQAELDRYNQVNPFGKLSWTQASPAPVLDANGQPTGKTAGQNQWTATQTLTPDAQHILDQQMGSGRTLSDVLAYRAGLAKDVANQPVASLGTAPNSGAILGQTAMNTVAPAQQNLANQLPLAGQYNAMASQLAGQAQTAAGRYAGDVANVAPVPTADAAYRDQVTNSLYGQMQSRLDPQWGQAQDDLEAKLAAQGITHGSEAYNRDYMNQQRAKTDAYQTAQNNAIAEGTAAEQAQFGMGLQANQQGMANAQAKAATPMNLMTSAQGANQGQQSNINAGLSGLLASTTALPSTANAMYGYENQGRLQNYTDQNTQLNNLLAQLNSIESGTATGSPSFTPQNTGVNMGSVDVAGITNNAYQGGLNAYNARVGQQNAMIGAGGLLGAAGAVSYFG
jgi:hypothetical protein